MNKLKQVLQIWQNMGSRYFLYRLRHEIERRTGALFRRFPVDPEEKYFSDKSGLQKASFYFSREEIKVCQNSGHRTKASQIREGKLHFFSAEWIDLGLGYNWRVNPKTGHEYPLIHWSKINDFDPKSGDIKYVWEKSRFAWLLELIREDYHQGSDHSAFVFDQIDAWIQANPINLGPNYRCSQEMSLRLWNWSFAFHFYYDSEAFTEDRWRKYQHVIYWHLDHIYKHIDFSRIAVRNNHAITETAMLFVSKWLFPFIPETDKWSKEGEKWFNEEIDYQIYEDGTFLQFSMNYHRVVVQTLCATIALAHRSGHELNKVVYDRAYASVNFLYQCMGNFQAGYLPNYGQNDGAWFFPWTNTDYRDYRPMLNALHGLLTGESLFSDSKVSEELQWWGGTSKKLYSPLQLQQGIVSFEKGGYYLIKEAETLLLFRNGNHKDRPAQADNQHLDLWHKGENLLMDSGTFNYNTEAKWLNYFMGSAGHNVLQIAGQDQMLKGGRFIWYYWSQADSTDIFEDENCFEIKAVVKAYRHIDSKVKVQRTIRKYRGENKITVTDKLLGTKKKHLLFQNWHTSALYRENFIIEPSAKLNEKDGYFSNYYGQKKINKHFIISPTRNFDTIKVDIVYP